MARLRRVTSEAPGITRVRRGRGFSYEVNGRTLTDEETLARLKALAIPPAWTDVWICRDPLGHLQAVGTDAAGRRQYRYHDRWRDRRDARKFDRMLAFAHRLPALRDRVAHDLALEDLPRDRALAAAVRLLDLASFRVGSETYARQNGSYGLATLRREHVRVSGDVIAFDYPAKSGKRRRAEVRDPDLAPVFRRLKRRRDGHGELLAYRQGTTWRDVRSADVNGYVKDAAGEEFTAKDFRTWHGTVLAAVALSAEPVPGSQTARRRIMTAAVNDVATFLGNTPAVARASYVDPRVFDRFEQGRTIEAALRSSLEPADTLSTPALRDAVEAAVLELLEEPVQALVA